MCFTAQIFSLALGGCLQDPHGMNFLLNGQRHILQELYLYIHIHLLKNKIKTLKLWFNYICDIENFLDQVITYWDDWLRLKENHKGRQFIRPEVCRTYNFGEHVSIFMNQSPHHV